MAALVGKQSLMRVGVTALKGKKMISRSVALAALTLAVAACSTTPPKTMSFGPQSATALLVSANPDLLQDIRIELRRVNMQSRTFEDQTIEIRNSDQINRSIFTGLTVDYSMPAMLGLHEVEPGQYAIVYMTSNSASPIAEFTYWRCFADGAPVFSVREGQISIVQMGEYWNSGRIGSLPTSMSDDRTLKSFSESRTRYPGIEGAPVLVGFSNVIKWAKADGETAPCVNSSSFESYTPSEWEALVGQ